MFGSWCDVSRAPPLTRSERACRQKDQGRVRGRTPCISCSRSTCAHTQTQCVGVAVIRRASDEWWTDSLLMATEMEIISSNLRGLTSCPSTVLCFPHRTRPCMSQHTGMGVQHRVKRTHSGRGSGGNMKGMDLEITRMAGDGASLRRARLGSLEVSNIQLEVHLRPQRAQTCVTISAWQQGRASTVVEGVPTRVWFVRARQRVHFPSTPSSHLSVLPSPAWRWQNIA